MTFLLLMIFLALAGGGVGLIHWRNLALGEASIDDGELETDFVYEDSQGVRIDV